jgi:predicted oxidoreductase
MTTHLLTDVRAWYGCMGLGGDWGDPRYTAADVRQAEEAVAAALEAGITAFDHADIYRHGKSEAVFGEVLAADPGLRERILVQTKCGIHLPTLDRIGFYDFRPAHLRDSLAGSLERLRTDRADVLLLHRPDALADWDAVASTLHDLHRQGLVRAVGVSNMAAAQIAALQARLEIPIVANQLELSLARRDFVEAGVLVNQHAGTAVDFPLGTLEHCATHGIQVQAWGSLAQGRYTGRQETQDEIATADLVTELAHAKGTTREAIVLWWLQRHPARIAPVIGTTSPDRIRACRDAATRESDLTHEEWYRLWVAARGERLP